ncbi:unnamed protein product [Prorocentrum cordatum]|uniref:AB hydrolase-1 domain-containing protein n=1 Tax=Prorocentrum cordatum TaxID=2364126 RepID=A0ABN9UGS5_9DINO|nr:unnamed protein product [Polarella glacialis]
MLQGTGDTEMPEGTSGHSPMRVGMDPISWTHRPFIFYVFTDLSIKAITFLAMRHLGFQHYCSGSLRYWYKPGDGPARVFCHGIGLGVLPYMQLLRGLSCEPGPLFAIELEAIAMRIQRAVPSHNEVAANIRDMLHAWGFASAHFIGHSFGTVVMAWVTKLYPAIICRASFLDPVVFLLCVPHMVYKFLYKEPREGIEKLMHFFVSSELYMANMMSRHFIWGEVCPPPRGLEVPQRSPGRAKQRRPAGAQPRGAAVHGQAGPARHRGGLARGRFPRRVPPEAEGAAHPARQASVTRARAASCHPPPLSGILRLPASPLPFVRRLSPRRAPLVGGTHLHVFFFAFAARAGRRGASGRASLRASGPGALRASPPLAPPSAQAARRNAAEPGRAGRGAPRPRGPVVRAARRARGDGAQLPPPPPPRAGRGIQ